MVPDGKCVSARTLAPGRSPELWSRHRLTMLLLEYGDQTRVNDRDSLESYLANVWYQTRDNREEQQEEKTATYQPFLSFDGNKARARNYIGFIKDGPDLIEIFPKVFRGLTDT